MTEINRDKIGLAAECYLKEKWGLNDQTMRSVLCKELGTVLQSAPFYKQVQYSRILHKQWATMQRNFKFHYAHACRDPLSVAFRNKQIIGLHVSLQKIHTNPIIINHIIRALYQCYADHNVLPIPILDKMSENDRLDSIAINQTMRLRIYNLVSAVMTRSFPREGHSVI